MATLLSIAIYLGSRFDGKRIYIRDSTRSRLQRKMTYGVNGAVRRLAQENPGSGRAELKKLFKPAKVLRQFLRTNGSVALTKQEFFGAEFFYCVAEFGCFFEFEFFGCFAHVGF